MLPWARAHHFRCALPQTPREVFSTSTAEAVLPWARAHHFRCALPQTPREVLSTHANTSDPSQGALDNRPRRSQGSRLRPSHGAPPLGCRHHHSHGRRAILASRTIRADRLHLSRARRGAAIGTVALRLP